MKGKQLLIFHLGLVMIVAPIVWGVVSHYYCFEVSVNGFRGKIEYVGSADPAEPRERVTGHVGVMATPHTSYPLRDYHFLTYLLLAIGQVMVLGSVITSYKIPHKDRREKKLKTRAPRGASSHINHSALCNLKRAL